MGFFQWGEMGDECHPKAQTCGRAFGPDVDIVEEGRSASISKKGVFGLSHKELLGSEWVSGDALTVKVEIEMRQAYYPSDHFPLRPKVAVPPSSLQANMLSLLS